MLKLDQLLQKEMTRRQFLGTLVTGVTSLFGVSALLGTLSEAEAPKNNAGPGYGMQNFGP